MKSELRRQGILKKLSASISPVSATILSEEFGVSRQIIVKDIAQLRLNGYSITALSKGYILNKSRLRF